MSVIVKKPVPVPAVCKPERLKAKKVVVKGSKVNVRSSPMTKSTVKLEEQRCCPSARGYSK